MFRRLARWLVWEDLERLERYRIACRTVYRQCGYLDNVAEVVQWIHHTSEYFPYNKHRSMKRPKIDATSLTIRLKLARDRRRKETELRPKK